MEPKHFNFLKSYVATHGKDFRKKKGDTIARSTAKFLLKDLKEIFNQRREVKSKKGKRLTNTGFVISDTILEKAESALEATEFDDIKNSFLAFADDILDGEILPKHILFYFFKEADLYDFPVIARYLDKYSVEYSYK